MNNDELDRILSQSLAEEELVPSSGFVASVMDAVRREATEPPPIPFPWKRALAGMVAAGLTLVWLLVEIVRHLRQDAATPHPSTGFLSACQAMLQTVMSANAGWLALAGAFVVSAASLILSMRLTSVNAPYWQRNR
jgi:hypothetical protein